MCAVKLPEELLNALLSANPFAVKDRRLTLAIEPINLADEWHSTHLFIYMKTEYERCSASAVFPR
ncbi:hypothetical protein ACNKHR_04045 [Shigella flexneri]